MSNYSNGGFIPMDDLELELEEVEPLHRGGGATTSDGGGRKKEGYGRKGGAVDPPTTGGGGGRGGGGLQHHVRTASFGNGPHPPSSSSSNRHRSRLFASLFFLLGIAMLLVMRGEEEVEMAEKMAELAHDGRDHHPQQQLLHHWGGGGNGADDANGPPNGGEPDDPAAAVAVVEQPPKKGGGADPPSAETSKKPVEGPKREEGGSAGSGGGGEGEEEAAEEGAAAATTTNDDAPKKTTATKSSSSTTKKVEIDWGEWHFWDGEPDTRPQNDYCADYPNRDIPGEKFPPTAWQVDAVYANHFLNDASKLVARAMEAIYAEYGWSKPLPPEKMMERSRMMKVHRIDLDLDEGDGEGKPPTERYVDNGGWTTQRSFAGLVRRLLHAIMTNDSFTVVIAGDGSAASGRGNHFLQTYGMQFQRIMEPIFGRLNVKFETRHMVRERSGGGPLEAALGYASILGGDDGVDLVVWDSSGPPPPSEEQGEEGTTTAKKEEKDRHRREMGMDLFARQAVLGGDRVPFLMDGGGFGLDVLKDLHREADVDVGGLGMGWSGIALTESDEQAMELPWAVRYLRCREGGGTKEKAAEEEGLCDRAENKYRTTCWVDRDDVVPPTGQDGHIVDGRDGSHPGWRYHQLKGRVLAFVVLEALQEAINSWSDVTITGGYPLPDEYWHVTEYYENIRGKVRKLGPGLGSCRGDLKEELGIPERVCSVPVMGRTEYTPRAHPDESSIVGMVKPAAGGYVPRVEEEMLYDGPDEDLPILEVPRDSLDVRAIVSAGIRRRLLDDDEEEEAIVPGLGWEVQSELPGSCNGTAVGICGRQKSSSCLLAGHMDSRGGLLGNEYSGWLVMNVKGLKEGVIILEMETSHGPAENKRTEGWTEAKVTVSSKEGDVVKDDEKETTKEKSDASSRMLRMGGKGAQPKPPNIVKASEENSVRRRQLLLPDTFKFDYAVDGKIITLDKKGFEGKKKKLRENVELLTVLDDATTTDWKEDAELALRMRGCGRDCTFLLTHVYWA